MSAVVFEKYDESKFTPHQVRAELGGRSVFIDADLWGKVRLCDSNGTTTSSSYWTAEQARAIGLELIRAANVSDELRKEAA